MDRETWIGDKPDLPKYIGDHTSKRRQVDITHLPVCPGWVVRQPAVYEASRAYAAMEKGCLAEMFPGNEAIVHDAAMILMSAYNRHSERDGN